MCDQLKITVSDFDSICKANKFSTFIVQQSHDNYTLNATFNKYETMINPLGSSVLFVSDLSKLCFQWVKYIKVKRLYSDITAFMFVCEHIDKDFTPKSFVYSILALKASALQRHKSSSIKSSYSQLW